jgi:hypothetical protein
MASCAPVRCTRAAELDKEVALFHELLTYLPAEVRADLGGRVFLTMFASPISSAGMAPRVPYDGFAVRHFTQEQAGHFLGTCSTVPSGLLVSP